MNPIDPFPLEGGCTCREVRYRLETRPIFVHCCHCRWCQRETGSAFALNAMIEADRVTLLQGKIDVVPTPSNSGKGQKISRCPKCRIAVWSNYAGAGDAVHFVQTWLAGWIADTAGILLALLWTAGFLPTFLEPRGPW